LDHCPVVEPDDAVEAHAVDLEEFREDVRLCLVRCVCFHRCFPTFREVAAIGLVAAFCLDLGNGASVLLDPVDKTAFKFHLVIAVDFGEIDRLGSGDLVHDSGIGLIG